MRILVVESKGYSQDALAVLRDLGEVICADIQERSAFLAALGGIEVLVVRLRHRIDAEVMDVAPHLRVIVSPTTGLDHIDLAAAANRGIAVLSLKGETAFLNDVTATAELTWALMLELARRVGAAHADVLSGRWERDAWVGRGLKGRTLGVLGFGRLGRIVSGYGHAFRMPVLVHDPHVQDYPAQVSAVTLPEVLAEADILSIHVSLEPATIGMIGAAEIAGMKPGAWLLNTARGQIVDEGALLAALRSGAIGAAALDVLADETTGGDGWLQGSALRAYARDHDNLILTPHIGGATVDAMAETEVFMARKLRGYLDAADHGIDAAFTSRQRNE